MRDSDSGGRFGALAARLDLLASPTRLEILHALRTSRHLSEIRVLPSLSREGENPERSLSRQGIQRHLEKLVEAGLVLRVPDVGGAQGDGFVLAHEHLFAMVDEIRGLAKLRRARGIDALGPTRGREADDRRSLPPRPRLVVAYGRDDGVAFALNASPGGRWRIGRGASCEVSLDYDPFASTEHCVIERTGSGFQILDSGSRNGTLLNWEEIPRGRARKLASGDLVGVGRSVLAFQE